MTPPHRRTRLGAVAGGVALLLVAVAGVAAAIGFGGGAEDDAAEADKVSSASATVTKQTLADAETVDGELGYGPSRTAASRLSGTITALPDAGATVRRGKALYTVDGDPVVLLYGKVPAYRTLQPGVEGADVAQLERNLKALGYTGFTVDDEYTWATADAVQAWQDDLGVAETGRVELGQIVYADSAVRVEGHQLDVGAAVQPGQAVLTYTGTDRLVTTELDVDDQRLAKRGESVEITLPDNKRVEGKISTVETVVKSTSAGTSGDSGTETKIEVVVSVEDQKALADFDRASAELTFTVSERPDVLTVPVAALLALAEGGYGLEIVEGGSRRIVAVTTGLFANGRVEVTGDGITEGTTVGMPR
ncbi:efflux RND transporter periplasmic adaptor subunit [Micromonospora endophytica]|uniref:Peptidoglycan-binding protein n=1 Tax=Micromonospora endophytica TaxID=515350 RepID=A0A2W2DUK1_9ACTN|nr:peptidoglycan-binding protein [Micromonospora endophytica]PZG00827.1 peptidoglycan-binding protein [Micromonospora endophytica]RIW42070.1 HlyD family efflux transporter periplasmic adaptor subunit [Micromonospora endophytica]